MRKYVFYLETNAPASEDQIFLLDLAAYMADYTDNDIYYINNYFVEELTRHPNTKLIFSKPDEFDFSKSNDAVFFTPVNYMMHLLVRAKDCPNAKICVYGYSFQAVDWLCNNMGNMSIKSEMISFLQEYNSYAFKHFGCVIPKDPLQRYEGITFLPSILNEMPVEPVYLDKAVSNDRINIGFYGTLDSENINMLNNLFSNLALSRIDKKIDIHIIGKASIVFNADFKKSSEELARLIFVGELEQEERMDYMRKNVDFVLASKRFAIEAATFGIPVIVPVTSTKPFNGNNYVYFYDVNGYRYSYNIFELLESNNTCYKIDKVLNDIYCENKKAVYAKKCFEYCLRHNAPQKIYNDFVDFIDNSILYVRDCLRNKNFSECLCQFESFMKKTNLSSFTEYISERKKELDENSEKKTKK